MLRAQGRDGRRCCRVGGAAAKLSTAVRDPQANRGPAVVIARVTCVTIALLCALAAAAAPARAQIIRLPRNAEPRVWTSAGVSLYQMGGVVDGRTQSVWDLGRSSAVQFRGSLEWGIRNQSSVGLTGTHARLPFRYFGLPPDAGNAATCDQCDAHVDVSSLALSFHAGGGAGLHQVIEAQAGVTRFANFRADDGRALAPLGGDRDLSFAFGYGVGYGFGPRVQVTLVQDFGMVMHQRTGLAGNEGSTIQQRMTRLGVRYGLFRRRPGV